MDRTITKSGTYSPWLWHWTGERAKWRRLLLPLSALAGLAYVLRLVDRKRLKGINHWLLMGGRQSAERVATTAESFAAKIVPNECYQSALDQIEKEKAEGRRVLLATASYAFYVRAVAERMGFEEIVATRVRRSPDGDVLAGVRGENCYADAKLRMVEQHLATEGIDRADAHVRFFSDHHSDEPCFAWADEAYAINGKGPMIRLAKKRGWESLRWT